MDLVIKSENIAYLQPWCLGQKVYCPGIWMKDSAILPEVMLMWFWIGNDTLERKKNVKLVL